MRLFILSLACATGICCFALSRLNAADSYSEAECIKDGLNDCPKREDCPKGEDGNYLPDRYFCNKSLNDPLKNYKYKCEQKPLFFCSAYTLDCGGKLDCRTGQPLLGQTCTSETIPMCVGTSVDPGGTRP